MGSLAHPHSEGDDVDLPSHDNDEELNAREELFVRLADRFPDQTYLELRDHFDHHVEDGKIEQAYCCLVNRMIQLAENLTGALHGIYEIFTGDDLTDNPKEQT